MGACRSNLVYRHHLEPRHQRARRHAEMGAITFDIDDVVLDDGGAKAFAPLPPGSYVMIALTDTGNGIPADIQAKVFEPFFFSTKETGKGTEFVVILSGEPQGGIKMRRRSPETAFGYGRPHSRPAYWRSPFSGSFLFW